MIKEELSGIFAFFVIRYRFLSPKIKRGKKQNTFRNERFYQKTENQKKKFHLPYCPAENTIRK